MLPRTQELDRVGTVLLHRIEDVGAPVGVVAGIAVVQRVAIVVEREHPAVSFHGHLAAVDFNPRLSAQPTHGADAQRDVSQDLIGFTGSEGQR